MICPRCGKEMIWGGDFDFEDYGMEEEGVVSNYSCPNCGVSAEVSFPNDVEEKEYEGDINQDFTFMSDMIGDI